MHTPCLRAVALAGETGSRSSGVGDRSPRWRAESRRLIPTGRGPDRAGAPGRQPRLTTSTYLCNTNVPFAHPSGVSGQKDGRKVRSRWEGTFTFRRAPLGHPDTVPGRAPARHLHGGRPPPAPRPSPARDRRLLLRSVGARHAHPGLIPRLFRPSDGGFRGPARSSGRRACGQGDRHDRSAAATPQRRSAAATPPVPRPRRRRPDFERLPRTD